MEKTLPSGAVLEVQLASWDACCELFEAVTAEAEKVKIDLGTMLGDMRSLRDFKGFAGMEISSEALDTLKNIAARMMSSKPIKEALWKCAAWATYNKVKIVRENKVFDPEEARGDYLLVMKEIALVNLGPFFKGLGSLLPEPAKKIT